MENKGYLAGLLVVGVIAVVALVLATKPASVSVSVNGGELGEQSYGGTTNLDSLTLSGTLTTADVDVTDDASVAGDVIQFGSDDVTTYIYVGTTDGCGAWTFSASGTTPTLTATSSAFCN